MEHGPFIDGLLKMVIFHAILNNQLVVRLVYSSLLTLTSFLVNQGLWSIYQPFFTEDTSNMFDMFDIPSTDLVNKDSSQPHRNDHIFSRNTPSSWFRTHTIRLLGYHVNGWGKSCINWDLSIVMLSISVMIPQNYTKLP